MDITETDSDRPKWLMLCTGGLLATGGLGWCIHLAYKEQPHIAMMGYLTGSAGVCLSNLAFYRLAKNSSRNRTPNWWMLLAGGVLFGTGFGHCLNVGLKDHPKSSMMAYAAGSLGFCLANSVLFTMITT